MLSLDADCIEFVLVCLLFTYVQLTSIISNPAHTQNHIISNSNHTLHTIIFEFEAQFAVVSLHLEVKSFPLDDHVEIQNEIAKHFLRLRD